MVIKALQSIMFLIKNNYIPVGNLTAPLPARYAHIAI